MTDKDSALQIHKSGSFPEQKTKNEEMPQKVDQKPADAPQSVLDTISELAVVEEEKDANVHKRKFSLPKIGVESFYARNHLKRRTKVLIGVYIFLVIGPLAYIFRSNWMKNQELTVQWEAREKNYVSTLTSVNIAEFNKVAHILDSGMQLVRDPIASLVTLETLARETDVILLNPSYVLSTVDKEKHIGIVLPVLVRGTSDDINTFLARIRTTKPVIEIQSFSVETQSDGTFQATMYLEYLYTTDVPDESDAVQEKLDASLPIAYPFVGIEPLVEQLDTFRTILVENIGVSELGKSDLFAF